MLSQIIPVLFSPVCNQSMQSKKGTMLLALTGAYRNTENMLKHTQKYPFSLLQLFSVFFLLYQGGGGGPSKSYLPLISSSFSSSLPLLPSSLFPLSLAQTRSHLWWGGVLYSINSRLHAKIHYANLLFLRTQACQLTCGTNFSLPPHLLFTHPYPPAPPTPANKYV